MAGVTVTQHRLIGQLFDAADDYEAAMLDELLIKAGVMWNCHAPDQDSTWTNPVGERCGLCNRTQRQAAKFDD